MASAEQTGKSLPARLLQFGCSELPAKFDCGSATGSFLLNGIVAGDRGGAVHCLHFEPPQAKVESKDSCPFLR
jgi:hypothetical protein